MRKFLLLSALTSISMLAASVALALPPEPQKCPGVASLIAGGVSRTVIQMDNRWFAGRRHQLYDTTNLWTFVVGNIDVTTAKDAYNQAAEALPTILFRMGPFSASDHWVCLYNTDVHNFPAVAITNPIALEEAPMFFNL